MTNTPMVHAPEVIAAYGGSAEEMVCRRDEQCPMGRMGDAWDVEYAAPFLASARRSTLRHRTGGRWPKSPARSREGPAVRISFPPAGSLQTISSSASDR